MNVLAIKTLSSRSKNAGILLFMIRLTANVFDEKLQFRLFMAQFGFQFIRNNFCCRVLNRYSKILLKSAKIKQVCISNNFFKNKFIFHDPLCLKFTSFIWKLSTSIKTNMKIWFLQILDDPCKTLKFRTYRTKYSL